MLTDQQVLADIQQLQQKYPDAFKYPSIWYGSYKCHHLGSIIPFLLALIIFLPCVLVIEAMLTLHSAFAPKGLGSIIMMLLFMLYVPFLIKQAKHSSHLFYQQQCHAPIKITLCIVVQAINVMYWQSRILESLTLTFAMSYGFVRFYRENHFLAHTQSYHFYALQQIRRACWWSYRRTEQHRIALKYTQAGSEAYQQQQKSLQSCLELHLSLYQYEYQLCTQYKKPYIKTMLDEII